MSKIILSLILMFVFAGVETAAQQPESAARDETPTEEYRRKVDKTEEKNRQIEENNQKIAQALIDGRAAYNKKDYQSAIEKFDEGYNLDPNYWGTAPIFLNNKAIALTQ